MSTNREYPAGALRALVANRAGHLHIYGTDDHFCRLHLDALAAMSPEDRAALALWLTRGIDFEADEAFEARVEAATVKRITEWLRRRANDMDAVGRAMRSADWRFAADAIEHEFGGGPDAVK
jgi:hypothetical protein